YVFHILGWLICCGELLNNAGFAKGASALGDVTPKIGAGCGRAFRRLIERATTPRKAKRFSEASHRAMSLHDRPQAVFFQCGNNNDGWSVFAHVRGLQDRHSLTPRSYV